ncbi:Kinesin-like protein [Daphnia magna]|uniref:Kinesin-like protein n=1 Tax=Daphnia magna TaxID=35525 RepID=A0A164MNT5_9CRUS|nr:Kinesin-like protein [Daphnia magna]
MSIRRRSRGFVNSCWEREERVYVVQENYRQITREIEWQRKEIVEKLEQIKAMEEQARKEESCQQLQGLYDEQTATVEELNSTQHNLSMTRSKLKQTRRQRDEKGHIVLHQTHTEQQLGSQARELLKVADVSNDHVRKLHSKLDRKRSVEKENERLRQSFEQNVARMEDGLENFVKDHTKFLSDIAGSYGTILAKQSSDLSVLSELMLQFAEGLRKAATDSTHSTQEFTKSFWGTTRTQVNVQAANQHQFLVDNFLPKFQSVSKSLQERGQAVQQLQRSLTEELQRQADLVKVLLADQKDGMNRLRQVTQQWDQQTEWHLRRISEQQTLSSQSLSEFDAEINKQMQMIINLVNSVQQTRENYKTRVNDTSTEEALLEEQRADMVTTVRERRDDVESHASSMSDWSSLLSTEIRQRNSDVVKFIVEDMRQEGPT